MVALALPGLTSHMSASGSNTSSSCFLYRWYCCTDSAVTWDPGLFLLRGPIVVIFSGLMAVTSGSIRIQVALYFISSSNVGTLY